MSVFGQVIPFRARRERAQAPPDRSHRSLSAALAEAGLAEPPPLSELTVDPEVGVVADEPIPSDEPAPADFTPPAPVAVPPPIPVEPVAVFPAAPVPSKPIPHWSPPPPAPVSVPAPAAAEAEPPLPRVIALAKRHTPTAAAYPWLKSGRRRRFRSRLADIAAWLLTIAIVAGMTGVAATYLIRPNGGAEPSARQ